MALIIEAGKFYRAENGAKVGPMHEWSSTVHRWQEGVGDGCRFDRNGDLWADDGTSIYKCPRLVEEWGVADSIEEARIDVVREATCVMALLAEHGPSIVPHLMDSDDNAGQRLRDALSRALAT